MKRLELIKKHPELREKLWENVRALQSGLRERGFDIGETNSPVTPVLLQNDGGIVAATAMVRELRESYGIFCSIVTYPVVPKKSSCSGYSNGRSFTRRRAVYAYRVQRNRRKTQEWLLYAAKSRWNAELAQTAVTASAAE